MADLATTPDDRVAYLTFVVDGAGPTGVELVGQVAELAHTVLPRDYRLIDTHEAIILLVEATPTVLVAFASRSSRTAPCSWAPRGIRHRGTWPR
jgi:NADH dehydrogenase